MYKCAAKTLSLEPSNPTFTPSHDCNILSSKKNKFVLIKPIFLILLEIRNRPFATRILCCHVVFAR